MCKYGLLYLVASVIAVLRVQLRFVDCINKQKKNNLTLSLFHKVAPLQNVEVENEEKFGSFYV